MDWSLTPFCGKNKRARHGGDSWKLMAENIALIAK
jgi:hypothetical protein